MKDILSFILSHQDAIITFGSAFILEVVARIKPTAKDWSIINFVKRLIDAIPNNAPDGQLHK